MESSNLLSYTGHQVFFPWQYPKISDAMETLFEIPYDLGGLTTPWCQIHTNKLGGSTTPWCQISPGKQKVRGLHGNFPMENSHGNLSILLKSSLVVIKIFNFFFANI
jgi:hypothetical protein